MGERPEHEPLPAPRDAIRPKLESYLNEAPCKEVRGYDKYED